MIKQRTNHARAQCDEPAFSEKLLSDADEWHDFMDIVEEIEEEENDGGRQGKRKRPGELDKPTTVNINDERGVWSETHLGVFWPEKEYKAAFPDKKIAKKDGYLHQGRKGIVVPSKHGCPDGCTRLYSFGKQSAAQASEVYSSKRARREGQGEEAFEQAKNAVQVNMKTAKTDVNQVQLGPKQSASSRADPDG